MNVPIHHRHQARLEDFDYSQNGAYFVTLCTWQRKEIFGNIISGEMQLNDWGSLVEREWRRANIGFADISMDVFIIMPNHLHGIIVIDRPGAMRNKAVSGGTCGPSRVVPARPAGSSRGSLGAIIGQFKSRASKQIMQAAGRISVSPPQVWQRNYFEHIIRDELEWDNIRKYIEVNPLYWHLDEENPGRSG